MDVIHCTWLLAISGALVYALVACVSEHKLFLSVRQFARLRDVVHVRCRVGHGVYQPTVSIRARVCFHAKVPLSAFLCLAHFFVPLTFWRVIRCNECRKLYPKHDAFHLFKKECLARLEWGGGESRSLLGGCQLVLLGVGCADVP